MITQERILKLAEMIAKRRNDLAMIEPLTVGRVMSDLYRRDLDDLEAVLRHYHEIMTAPTVAYQVEFGGSEVILQTMNVVKGYLGGRKGVVRPLIAKPGEPA